MITFCLGEFSFAKISSFLSGCVHLNQYASLAAVFIIIAPISQVTFVFAGVIANIGAVGFQVLEQRHQPVGHLVEVA